MIQDVIFWVLIALLFYTYIGYGLIVLGIGALVQKSVIPTNVQPLSATMLIAAHNEGQNIRRKLQNALSLELGKHSLEILVVSDGSTDNTVEEVLKFQSENIHLIEITDHVGKVSAINQALPTIDSDVVIFSDADSEIHKKALVNLLRHFSDEQVGGVLGKIDVSNGRESSWASKGEALYWQYDNKIKEAESRIAGAVSAAGALYAIRRELVAPLISGIADDLLASLRVVRQHKRLVFDKDSLVAISLTGSIKREFDRRVRLTEQGFRGLLFMKTLLNPFQFGFYSFQLFSHKWMRRLGPFMFVLLIINTCFLLGENYLYNSVVLGGLIFLSIFLLGWFPIARKSKILSSIFFIVHGNIAMAIGVLNAIRGKETTKWTPVR